MVRRGAAELFCIVSPSSERRLSFFLCKNITVLRIPIFVDFRKISVLKKCKSDNKANVHVADTTHCHFFFVFF